MEKKSRSFGEFADSIKSRPNPTAINADSSPVVQTFLPQIPEGIQFVRNSDGSTFAGQCAHTMSQVQITYRELIPDFHKLRTYIIPRVQRQEKITPEQVQEALRETRLGEVADLSNYAHWIRRLGNVTEDRRIEPLSPAKLTREFIVEKTGLGHSTVKSYVCREERLKRPEGEKE